MSDEQALAFNGWLHQNQPCELWMLEWLRANCHGGTGTALWLHDYGIVPRLLDELELLKVSDTVST